MGDFNSTHNRTVWVDIPVADLDRAATFYRAVLDIKAEVEEHNAGMMPDIRQGNVRSALYTYRTLSLDEIDKYVEFAESGAGTKYHTVISEGMSIVMVDAAKHMADIMMRDFSEPQ